MIDSKHSPAAPVCGPAVFQSRVLMGYGRGPPLSREWPRGRGVQGNRCIVQ